MESTNKTAILNLLAKCREEAGEKLLFRCDIEQGKRFSSQDAGRVADELMMIDGEVDIHCWSTATWKHLGWFSILPQEEARIVSFSCNEFCSAVCGVSMKSVVVLISACKFVLRDVEFKLYAGDNLLCTKTSWVEPVKEAIVRHRADGKLVLECYNPRGGHYLGSFYLEPTKAELVSKRTLGDDGGNFVNEVIEIYKDWRS